MIPAGYVENLEKQIEAVFFELTEKERNYDREEVLKNWLIFAELGG